MKAAIYGIYKAYYTARAFVKLFLPAYKKIAHRTAFRLGDQSDARVLNRVISVRSPDQKFMRVIKERVFGQKEE